MARRNRYYAYRVLPNGQRKRLRPGGRLFFGAATLSWLRRRARKAGYRIIVGQVRNKRDLIMRWCRWALSNEPSIHYRQSRPIPLKAGKAHQLPLYTDCSGSAVIAYYAAGLPDPSGYNYDGGRTKPTYTGSIRAHAKRKKFEHLRPGDLIVYGPGTGAHMVIVMSGGRDPLVFSHGQESGPRQYRHSVQVAVHGNTFTCHDAGV